MLLFSHKTEGRKMMHYEIQTDQIKQQMLNKGYSINKLSKESKISKSTISRILSKTCNPRPETIYKIAAALNLEIKEITNYEEEI